MSASFSPSERQGRGVSLACLPTTAQKVRMGELRDSLCLCGPAAVYVELPLPGLRTGHRERLLRVVRFAPDRRIPPGRKRSIPKQSIMDGLHQMASHPKEIVDGAVD